MRTWMLGAIKEICWIHLKKQSISCYFSLQTQNPVSQGITLLLKIPKVEFITVKELIAKVKKDYEKKLLLPKEMLTGRKRLRVLFATSTSGSTTFLPLPRGRPFFLFTTSTSDSTTFLALPLACTLFLFSTYVVGSWTMVFSVTWWSDLSFSSHPIFLDHCN